MKRLFLVVLLLIAGGAHAFQAETNASNTYNSPLLLQVIPVGTTPLEFKAFTASETGTFGFTVKVFNPQLGVPDLNVSLKVAVNDIVTDSLPATLTISEEAISPINFLKQLQAGDRVTFSISQSLGHPVTIQAFYFAIKAVAEQ